MKNNTKNKINGNLLLASQVINGVNNSETLSSEDKEYIGYRLLRNLEKLIGTDGIAEVTNLTEEDVTEILNSYLVVA